MTQIRKVLHLRTSGETAPSTLQPGEIAVRYKKGKEALFISTTDGTSDIVSFESTAQVLAAAELYTDTHALSAVTSGTGIVVGAKSNASQQISLATTGTSGTYTKVVTDSYGRVTSGSSQITESDVTNLTTDLAAKVPTSRTITTTSGLTGGGNLSADRTIGLAATGTAGTYGPTADVTGTEGTTIKVPQITTDKYGRVTSVTERTLTNKNTTYTVNNGTFTVSGNGATVASTSANASNNTGVNFSAGTNVTITTGTSTITVSSHDTKYTFTGGTNQFTYSEDGGAAQTVTVTPSITNNVTGSGLTADTIIVGNGSSAIKSSGVAIETALTSTSDVKVPTSKAIATYVTQQMASALTYKGTAPATLPSSPKVGDLYVVATAGTYAGQACEVGDYIICRTSSPVVWDVINGENQVTNSGVTLSWGTTSTIANVDGTNITVGLPSNPDTNYYTSGLTVSTSTTANTITVKGNNSAVKGSATLSGATTSAAGLMTTAHVTQLNNLDTKVDDLSGQTETISRAANNLDDRVVELSGQVSAISADMSNVVLTSRTISTASGLTGGGNLSADRTIGLAATGTAGTYTKVVTDSYGRVTSGRDITSSELATLGALTAVTSGTGIVVGAKSSGSQQISLATTGTAGTYKQVVVDAYGRVTSGNTADVDSWRPVKVNGTNFLTDSTTPLNLANGSSISITTGTTGTVNIAVGDIDCGTYA